MWNTYDMDGAGSWSMLELRWLLEGGRAAAVVRECARAPHARVLNAADLRELQFGDRNVPQSVVLATMTRLKRNAVLHVVSKYDTEGRGQVPARQVRSVMRHAAPLPARQRHPRVPAALVHCARAGAAYPSSHVRCARTPVSLRLCVRAVLG